MCIPRTPIRTHRSTMPSSLKKEEEAKRAEFDRSNLEADPSFVDERRKRDRDFQEEESLMDKFIGFLKG